MGVSHDTRIKSKTWITDKRVSCRQKGRKAEKGKCPDDIEKKEQVGKI